MKLEINQKQNNIIIEPWFTHLPKKEKSFLDYKTRYCIGKKDTSNQSISNASFTYYQINSFSSNFPYMKDENQYWITIPNTGYYNVSFTINWTSNSTGIRSVFLHVNGLDTFDFDWWWLKDNRGAVSGGSTINQNTWLYKLNAWDVVKLYIYQNSGSALTVERQRSHLIITSML